MKTRRYKHWLWICAAWLTACYTIDAQASDGVREWSRIWGSPTVDVTKSCATDAAGDIYIAGRTFAAFDGQSLAGSSDACLRKYNAAGIKQWTRIWGSTEFDVAYAVGSDASTNIYVCGGTAGAFDGQTNTGVADMFLTKFNAAGIKQWTRIWGSALNDSAHAIATDPAGNIYLTGYAQSDFGGQTNAGMDDACLVKYNATGTRQWVRIWGSPAGDDGYGIAVDAVGNAYVGGTTYGGFDGQTNTGGVDFFLTKHNTSGARQWTQVWGSPATDSSENGNCLALDDAGANLYLAGYTTGAMFGQTNAGNTDICLTKHNVAGTRQWVRIWGSGKWDWGEAACCDADGNVYVAGETFGAFDGQTSTGMLDACLTKLSAAGTRQWSRIWGSTNTDSGLGLAADTAGNIYVAGQTKAGFDGQTTAGFDDMFLSKFMLPEPAGLSLLLACALCRERRRGGKRRGPC